MRTPDDQTRIEVLERYRSAIGFHRLCIDLRAEPHAVICAHREAIRTLRQGYAQEQGPLR